MRVYLGHDPREENALAVAVKSLRKVSPTAHVTTLRADRLRDAGLLNRPTDLRGGIFDLGSNAPCSTQFAFSRFLVPILAQEGWALFADCDVVFLRDVAELFALARKEYAVMVVKHQPLPDEGRKMDDQPQQPYARKNWSSVMLWNCDHPANRRLSLHDVNTRPGRDLHRFYWLHDDEIGGLPAGWNWLVDVQPEPRDPCIAHFTLGIPTMRDSDHAALWHEAAR